MRKYQQLLLIAVSALSVGTLLLYRSENGRLKYVLDVVNFFGQQTDRHVGVAGEPSFEFTTPFPIWQRIGKGFHAYAAFWRAADRVAGTGEVISIVVGLRHAIVSFRCDVRSGSASHAARFGFNREEPAVEVPMAAKQGGGAAGDEYIVYKFICKVSDPTMRTAAPHRITFTDLSTKQAYSIGIRDLSASALEQQRRPASDSVTKTLLPTLTTTPSRLVACVNLISPLTPGLQRYFTKGDRLADRHLLEFFLHHHVIGVHEFIVYDNRDQISLRNKQRLAQHNVRLTYLPFNFPFALVPGADDPKLRRILQLDCELRTLNISHWYVVAQPNEVLHTDEFLYASNSTLTSLLQRQQEHHRFEVHTNVVCINTTVLVGKSIDDSMYTIATPADAVLLPHAPATTANYTLRRPHLQTTTAGGSSGAHVPDERAQRLTSDRLLANRYVECRPMDRNTEVTHVTWPATVESSETRTLMRFFRQIRTEVLKMLEKPIP